MKPSVPDPVHALIVPLSRVSLLIPSSLVAEVVNAGRLTSVALSPPWMLGILNWRSRPVPVVSFEVLAGGAMPVATSRSKIVIFYPLQGRKPWEFFGVLTSAEAQPRTFHDAQALSSTVPNNNPYFAVALQLEQSLVGIPDLARLKKAFYPAA